MGIMMDEVNKLHARLEKLKPRHAALEAKWRTIDWEGLKADFEDLLRRVERLELKRLERESIERVLKKDATGHNQ